MNENDFELLCESIRQAGEIRRGVRKPSRTFAVENPDPKAIRERLGLSQSRFASIIGVSVRTLQNWEQGRREPEGPAKVSPDDFRKAMSMVPAGDVVEGDEIPTGYKRRANRRS